MSNQVEPIDSLFKQLYVVKRLIDQYADEQFDKIVPEFKSAYLPIFMCLKENGITNQEIADELHITKMAASKTIKTLIALDLVYKIKNPNDGRTETIFFTTKGFHYFDKIKTLANELVRTYEKLLGKDKYITLRHSLNRMIDYHQKPEIK